jgi:A/G-specific adenine glycosylase
LLAWYDTAQRELPWRPAPSLYAVWVSEIMLQQTVAQTVVPYYRRFLARFPTVRALASAPLGAVLKEWEGLGYYRRARHLHAAAQEIVVRHRGRFPTDIESLLNLPGIGRYTAGAILSIGRNKRWPVLEANTRRVYRRLGGWTGANMQSANDTHLWRFAESILPHQRVGDFNQALMDLGSQICRPRVPLCGQCPLENVCVARRQGVAGLDVAGDRRAAIVSVREVAVVVEHRGRLLLRRCQDGQRWAGMWDLPRYAVSRSVAVPRVLTLDSTPSADALAGELARALERDAGVAARLLPTGVKVRHSVTRYRIELAVLVARGVSRRTAVGRIAAGFQWVPASQLNDLPLPPTARSVLDQVHQLRSPATVGRAV